MPPTQTPCAGIPSSKSPGGLRPLDWALGSQLQIALSHRESRGDWAFTPGSFRSSPSQLTSTPGLFVKCLWMVQNTVTWKPELWKSIIGLCSHSTLTFLTFKLHPCDKTGQAVSILVWHMKDWETQRNYLSCPCSQRNGHSQNQSLNPLAANHITLPRRTLWLRI